MKKLIIFFAIVIGCTEFATSQITGGGVATPQSSEPETQTVSPDLDPVWGRSKYFTFQYSAPRKELKEDPIEYTGSGIPWGLKAGLGFNMGKVYYLNQIDFTQIGLPDGFKLGIDVTYIGVSVMWGKGEYADYDYSYNSLYLGVYDKVGPEISYNVIDKLIVGVNFTFQPSFAYYLIDQYYETTYYDSYYGYTYSESDDDLVQGIAFKLRKGFGLSARYDRFRVGLEWSWGDPKNVSLDDNYETIGEYDLSSSRFDFQFGWAL